MVVNNINNCSLLVGNSDDFILN